MEKANENVIQYNIGSTGNGHKIHGSFGITNATEYGADYVISCNKGNSDKTDDKILCGTCHRFCRDTDQYNNGPDEEKKQENLDTLHSKLLTAAAVSGISPDELETMTPASLREIERVAKEKNGERLGLDKTAMQKDYDLARREIHKRLVAEKEAREKQEAENG